MKTLIFLSIFVLVDCLPKSSVPKFDRIVGGKPADISAFPYQVSIRIFDEHHCGGSILDQTTIVTAAHCVSDKGNISFTIRVGHSDNRLGKQYTVKELRIHPYYRLSTKDYDVAVLKLSSPIQYSKNIQPIELVTGGVRSGRKSVVSGWGSTRECSCGKLYLQYVELDVIDKSTCNRMYDGRITNNMMCAFNIDKDSCYGDSGGPLVSGGKLIGIVSWGIGCARSQYPGVYADVAVLNSWIRANTH